MGLLQVFLSHHPLPPLAPPTIVKNNDQKHIDLCQSLGLLYFSHCKINLLRFENLLTGLTVSWYVDPFYSERRELDISIVQLIQVFCPNCSSITRDVLFSWWLATAVTEHSHMIIVASKTETDIMTITGDHTGDHFIEDNML